jgi:hypothetical protein
LGTGLDRPGSIEDLDKFATPFRTDKLLDRFIEYRRRRFPEMVQDVTGKRFGNGDQFPIYFPVDLLPEG